MRLLRLICALHILTGKHCRIGLSCIIRSLRVILKGHLIRGHGCTDRTRRIQRHVLRIHRWCSCCCRSHRLSVVIRHPRTPLVRCRRPEIVGLRRANLLRHKGHLQLSWLRGLHFVYIVLWWSRRLVWWTRLCHSSYRGTLIRGLVRGLLGHETSWCCRYH